jgi:ferredoxin
MPPAIRSKDDFLRLETTMDLRMGVNPITCAGHGMCAELLPERISMDEWGYPIIEQGPVPGELEQAARKAVAECPTLALYLLGQDERG